MDCCRRCLCQHVSIYILYFIESKDDFECDKIINFDAVFILQYALMLKSEKFMARNTNFECPLTSRLQQHWTRDNFFQISLNRDHK